MAALGEFDSLLDSLSESLGTDATPAYKPPGAAATAGGGGGGAGGGAAGNGRLSMMLDDVLAGLDPEGQAAGVKPAAAAAAGPTRAQASPAVAAAVAAAPGGAARPGQQPPAAARAAAQQPTPASAGGGPNGSGLSPAQLAGVTAEIPEAKRRAIESFHDKQLASKVEELQRAQADSEAELAARQKAELDAHDRAGDADGEAADAAAAAQEEAGLTAARQKDVAETQQRLQRLDETVAALSEELQRAVLEENFLLAEVIQGHAVAFEPLRQQLVTTLTKLGEAAPAEAAAPSAAAAGGAAGGAAAPAAGAAAPGAAALAAAAGPATATARARGLTATRAAAAMEAGAPTAGAGPAGSSAAAASAAPAKKKAPATQNDKLIEAARAQRQDEVAKMIEQEGVGVDSFDFRTGDTPLHAAVEVGSRKLVTYLMSQGADIISRNRRGATPLQSAMERSDDAMVRWLIQNFKANPYVKDNIGTSPWSIAGAKPAYQDDLGVFLSTLEFHRELKDQAEDIARGAAKGSSADENAIHTVTLYVKGGKNTFDFAVTTADTAESLTEAFSIKIKAPPAVKEALELAEDTMGKQRALEPNESILTVKGKWGSENPKYFRFLMRLKRGTSGDTNMAFRSLV